LRQAWKTFQQDERAAQEKEKEKAKATILHSNVSATLSTAVSQAVEDLRWMRARGGTV
jgi:hypothetical protein